MSRLLQAWRLLNLPCQGMTRLGSEALDRPLNRVERAALWSHLVYCAPCRRYVRQIKILGQAVNRLAGHRETEVEIEADTGPGAPVSGPALPDHVREEIKRKLKEE